MAEKEKKMESARIDDEGCEKYLSPLPNSMFRVHDLMITVIPERGRGVGSVILDCDSPTRTCLAGDSATIGSCTSEGCSPGLVDRVGDPAYFRELSLVLERALKALSSLKGSR